MQFPTHSGTEFLTVFCLDRIYLCFDNKLYTVKYTCILRDRLCSGSLRCCEIFCSHSISYARENPKSGR